MIGKNRDECDQHDRRNVAGTEPQQEQWRVGETRDRRTDAHERQQDIFGASRPPHKDADRHSGQRRERETGGETNERVQGVMRQNAIECEPHEHGGDGFQRREKLRRKQSKMRHRLPRGADHDERKRIARRSPERAGIDAKLRGREIGNILH